MSRQLFRRRSWGEADAIHPGYGFLSENVRLARSAREHGLIFIGPTDANLEAVGDKLARALTP